MTEEQEFPKSVGANPYVISRWLGQLQDWVDGPLRACSFLPADSELYEREHKSLYISHERYERMIRESRAYYAMRDEIREMANHLLSTVK